MAETQLEKDKRATRRFALHLPVSVRYGENPERDAQTQRRQRARRLLLPGFRDPGGLGN